MTDFSARKFVALDGLRAFCALAVILVHTAPAAIPNGKIGVDVFFVLSGFLITRLLVKEYERGPIDLFRFYVRRAARLWPALLLLLAFWCSYVGLFMSAAQRNDELIAAIWAGFYVMNWVRAFTNWSQGDFGHTWSLAIEEQFYLLWPLALGLILKAGPRRRLAIVASLIVAVIAWRAGLGALGASVERLYNGFDTRADGLLFGCFLGLAPATAALFRWARHSWLVPAILLLALTWLPPATTAWAITWSYPLVGALAAWLIAGIRDENTASVLSHPWVVYMGRISYGVYLWHYPLTLTVVGHFHLSAWTAPPVVTLLSIACAALSFHVVEQPVRGWVNARLDRRAEDRAHSAREADRPAAPQSAE